MHTTCPHCRTEYDAEDDEYGRFVKCAVCGKGFVAGTSGTRTLNDVRQTVRRVAADTANAVRDKVKEVDWDDLWNRTKRAYRAFVADLKEQKVQRRVARVEQNPNGAKLERFWKRIASAPWQIQFVSGYLYCFGLIFAGGTLVTGTPPSSFVHAVVVFAIATVVSFTLFRFNFVRWLLIVWGAFNLIVLLFGSKDNAFVWPFHVSFIAVAILLLAGRVQQWYRDGPKADAVADRTTLRRRWACAASLAILASILFFVGYSEKRKEIRIRRGTAYSDDRQEEFGGRHAGWGGDQEETARAVLKGALANVRSRYRNNLSRLGLTESYYDETNGICDLMLLDVGTWTKYQIVYYRSTGQIEWPRMMPKSVAESLMHDRMLIDSYEKTTSR